MTKPRRKKKTTENLMPKLEEMRNKDVYYHIKANTDRMLAPQDAENIKLLKLPSTVSVVIVDTTETEIGGGNETVRRIREQKRNIKKGQEMKVHTFKTEKDNIQAPMLGDRGILRTGLYRLSKAMNKAHFWEFPIDLVRTLGKSDGDFENMDMGKAPAERPIEKPIFILEPRSKGKTAEVVGYEAIQNRPFEFWLKRNSACPFSDEEILQMVHGLEDVPLGPGKRGHITVSAIEKATKTEFEEWLKQQNA